MISYNPLPSEYPCPSALVLGIIAVVIVGPLDQPPLGAIRPSIGLLALAYSLRGIRPDRNASRPASQAYRIAHAIRTGSDALAIAVLSNTPSQPNSIATDTSLAVPTPASTITG